MFSENTIPDSILRVIILGPVSLVWVALVVRMIGLRTFSKMTAFDFVATIATGSLLANAASAETWPSFFVSSAAILTILGTQAIIAKVRVRSKKLVGILENEPILLMRDGEIMGDNMKKARVAEDDLIAKLREANVLDFKQVRAVVLETTGDISVLHGSHLEESVLKSVRRS